ncbi:DUF1127 domain-containing protein [Neorhizobium phenanthreniclasticum]|uniref:DUF1127 domain-containing protein n=1 Tax=Neorhizobium phenanthreniclasticum TaxID=3157917 RepID=UPI0039F5EF06
MEEFVSRTTRPPKPQTRHRQDAALPVRDACCDRLAGDRICLRRNLGDASVNGGLFRTALAALGRKLCGRRSAQGNRPLSRLDDRLLDDLGITREQASELDRRREHQTRSNDSPD